MKGHKHIRILMLCIMGMAVAHTLEAQETATMVDNYTFDVGLNAEIEISGAFGPVVVTGIAGEKAYITVERKATATTKEEAKALVGRIEANIESKPGVLRVAAKELNMKNKIKENGYQTSITVKVPVSSVMSVRNKFGDIQVHSIQSEVRLAGKHCNIQCSDVSDVEVTNQFGSIVVTNVKGRLHVRNQHGTVECIDFTDGQIENKFGATVAMRATGELSIVGQHGSIHVNDVARVSVENQFGSVTVTDVKGDVAIRAAHGSIECNSFSNGTFTSTYGSIRVRHPRGSIAVKGNSSEMTLEDVLDATVHNKHAETTITVSKSFKGAFDLRAKMGVINSKLATKASTITSKRSGKEYLLTGKMGNGSGIIKVESNMGNITISQ